MRIYSLIVGLFGTINTIGGGVVNRHRAVIICTEEINAGDVVVDKAKAFVGWSGRILLSALEQLSASCPFFGRVEFTDDLPMVITDSSWLWWRKNKTPSPPPPRDAHKPSLTSFVNRQRINLWRFITA